jgi:hypothetical protein
MTIERLTCPVCGRTEIETDICPNCETDLSLLRLFSGLPPAEPPPKSKVNINYLLNIGIVATIVLVIELGLHLWTLY